MNTTQVKKSLILLLTATIWGTAFVAQSVGMVYVEPFTFTCARSIIGGMVLIPVIWFFSKGKEGPLVTKAELLGGICCGLALCAASNFQQIGIAYDCGKGWIYYGALRGHCANPRTVSEKESFHHHLDLCGSFGCGTLSSLHDREFTHIGVWGLFGIDMCDFIFVTYYDY